MKRVMVGMSGGVDSSAAAFLLKKSGYDVLGVTIKLWDNFDREKCEKVCCSIEDVYDAKRVCDSLGIPHYTVGFKEEFKENVIDYFLNEYDDGNTPSPCIMCNETVKFGKMLEFAESIGCDYIATGHYADTSFFEKTGRVSLKRCKDTFKDQTYMLYRLSENQLKKVLFPLSGLEKKDVRKIAEENKILTYNKPDSQGICFVMGDYKKFLLENLGEKIEKGNFIDECGNIIGKHEGYQFYTIGQRRGLGLNNSSPYFIIDIIPKTNTIVVGDFKKLLLREVILRNVKLNCEKKFLNNLSIVAKPRLSSKGQNAKIFMDNGEIKVIFEKENAENSRGQHMVLYYMNYVLGGGIIV